MNISLFEYQCIYMNTYKIGRNNAKYINLGGGGEVVDN